MTLSFPSEILLYTSHKLRLQLNDCKMLNDEFDGTRNEVAVH
jgi:hypothetical protein